MLLFLCVHKIYVGGCVVMLVFSSLLSVGLSNYSHTKLSGWYNLRCLAAVTVFCIAIKPIIKKKHENSLNSSEMHEM